MSQFYIDSSANPGGAINTLSAEGGPLTPPNGTNFNFSGSVAGGAASNGAILFNAPSNGEMDAVVQTDNATIFINSNNDLQVGLTGTTTTSDGAGQTQTILSFAMTVGSSVTIVAQIVGIEPVNPYGAGGTITATFFRGAGGATLVSTGNKFFDVSNAAIGASDIDASVSGNNAIITVTGTATYTIRWKCNATYVEQTAI